MNIDSGLKTIDKMVKLLECFNSDREIWSLKDLSALLKIPKPTLHRMMVSLERYGILRRIDDENYWALGYRLFVWGSHVSQISALRQICRPYLRDIVANTNETAVLTVYDHLDMICIDKFESAHAVRITLVVGVRRAPHAGASSKILMAYLSPGEIQTIINRGLPRFTINTITDPDQLIENLSQIRSDGYSFTCEENDLGAWGLAVPLFDSKHNVVAAIGLAGPTSRFTNELLPQYLGHLRFSARKIEAIMTGAEIADNKNVFEKMILASDNL